MVREWQVISSKQSRFVLSGALACAIAALAGCAPKPVPVPPPPPVVVIPPRPYPPMGASPNLVTPPIGIDGARRTVNVGLTPAQTVWNLRSAFNVAALNCQKPEHAGILAGYRDFLIRHAKTLTKYNRTVDDEFKGRAGNAGYVTMRESYMTQVYNYFALPPTLPAFCDAVLAVSVQSAAVASADLPAFAQASLPQLEAVFTAFYNSYDQYRADLAAWDARYAPRPVSQPLLSQQPLAGPPSGTPRGPAMAQ